MVLDFDVARAVQERLNEEGLRIIEVTDETDWIHPETLDGPRYSGYALCHMQRLKRPPHVRDDADTWITDVNYDHRWCKAVALFDSFAATARALGVRVT